MIKEILNRGVTIHPRKDSSLNATKEILGAQFVIPASKPLCTLKGRNLSFPFALAEPFFLLKPQDKNTVDALCTYAPRLRELAVNEKTGLMDGHYSQRIILPQGDQMLQVFNLLRKDPLSRRAVVTIHNPVWDRVDGDSKDICCTCNLHFMIRGGKLHCFCHMRSNDLWLGTVHNANMFTFLQRALAGWLGIKPGLYAHTANSLHMYENHLEKARNLLRAPETFDMLNTIAFPQHSSPEFTYAAAETFIAW